MNLQPLYDLKERLHYAAIAGAGLLGEDFRLQRAAEGLKPLASASPVFSKIDGMLSALLQAPPPRTVGHPIGSAGAYRRSNLYPSPNRPGGTAGTTVRRRRNLPANRL